MKRILVALFSVVGLVGYVSAIAFALAMIEMGDGAPPHLSAIRLIDLIIFAPILLFVFLFLSTLPVVSGNLLKLIAVISSLLGVPILVFTLSSKAFVFGVPLLGIFGLWLLMLRERLHLRFHPLLRDSIVIPCGALFLIGVFCSISGLFYRSMNLMSDAWMMWGIAGSMFSLTILLFIFLRRIRQS